MDISFITNKGMTMKLLMWVNVAEIYLSHQIYGQWVKVINIFIKVIIGNRLFLTFIFFAMV
jgi:hypothetical protein